MEKSETKICCICGKRFTELGNSPVPVRQEGECCRNCNWTIVLPERFKRSKQLKKETMEKDKVYISGAIAHYNIDERKGAFANAEQNLRNMGFSPVNPFKNGLPDEAHWREHMRADIALLLDCEYIYMLKDWELSKGAKLELDVASSCGIKVLFE